jgi:hydroxymethylglutaryl-CoA lyase
MFEHMGVRTGIDIAKLIEVARDGATLPGALVGGRVRDAVSAAAHIDIK